MTSSLRLPCFLCYSKAVLGRIITVVTLAAAIALLLILQSSSPSTAGPGGVLAVFFLLYCIIAGCLTWLIRVGSWVLVHIANPFRTRRPAEEISLLRAYYFASVAAMGPVMLVGIISVGSIGFYEVALIILFEIISLFYVKKRFR